MVKTGKIEGSELARLAGPWIINTGYRLTHTFSSKWNLISYWWALKISYIYTSQIHTLHPKKIFLTDQGLSHRPFQPSFGRPIFSLDIENISPDSTSWPNNWTISKFGLPFMISWLSPCNRCVNNESLDWQPRYRYHDLLQIQTYERMVWDICIWSHCITPVPKYTADSEG